MGSGNGNSNDAMDCLCFVYSAKAICHILSSPKKKGAKEEDRQERGGYEAKTYRCTKHYKLPTDLLHPALLSQPHGLLVWLGDVLGD